MKHVTSSDGTRIAYDESGSGPVMILVAGAMIERNFSKSIELAELLSTQLTVINYDRRGRGDSTDTLPYSPDRELEDLRAIIDEKGPSYVFGLSSGAALALHAAATDERVRGLALYEPPYIQPSGSTEQSRTAYIENLERLISEGRRGDVVKSFLKLVGVPAFIRFIMPLMPFWKSAVKIAHTIPYDLRILGDRAIPADWTSKIKVPTLVMSGELSTSALKDAARATSAQIGSAKYLELKGQRHDVSPSVLAATLINFFL